MSMILATSCAPVTPTSGDAICAGSRDARADLAEVLAVSPDDDAVRAGARLIVLVDAGCAK